MSLAGFIQSLGLEIHPNGIGYLKEVFQFFPWKRIRGFSQLTDLGIVRIILWSDGVKPGEAIDIVIEDKNHTTKVYHYLVGGMAANYMAK